MTSEDRHSKRKQPLALATPSERAPLEAKNALRQYDRVADLIAAAIGSGKPFRLRPSYILELHRLATEGTIETPGTFRPFEEEIVGSEHDPPPPIEVAALVEEMCDYVGEHWDHSPIHLAAYVLWRLNWIHPFEDGNGRTARAVSYLTLCVRLGFQLPGTNTIPDQISANKGPYYAGLEAADAAEKNGRLDLSELEALLSEMLAAQLSDIFSRATGHLPT